MPHSSFSAAFQQRAQRPPATSPRWGERGAPQLEQEPHTEGVGRVEGVELVITVNRCGQGSQERK